MRHVAQLVFLLAVSSVQASAQVSFARDVQPILEQQCWKCHGGAVQLGKLDLRTRETALKGGDKGPALVPGKSADSRLIKLVSGLEKPAMPIGGKLTEDQISTLRRWIDEGAHWEGATPAANTSDAAAALKALEDTPLPPGARDYWAFKKPVRGTPPGSGHPVDAFLAAEWKARGLEPAPRASKETLVRRAYLDLTGLPPAPSEVDEYVRDARPDAWARLIDKLLASPAYGERWGRHWLDVARYADSNGFEHDFDRPNAWRYRDYVIAAFNKDKPYDQFLREQLAGDELPNPTFETLTATGFLRNHAKVGFREKDNPQFRYEYLDDMIATVGRGVMGLTIQCARCHNHKFDPILQKDYYRLQASLFGYVEVDHPLVPKAEADAWKAKMAAIDESIKPLREQIQQLEAPYREKLQAEIFKKFPQHIQDAINTPEEKRTPGQMLLANQVIRTTGVSAAALQAALTPEHRKTRSELQEQIKRLEAQRPAPIPTAMGITDGDYRFAPDGPGDEPAPGKGIKREATEGSFLWEGKGRYQAPPAHFLYHGDAQSRGSEMQPGFPQVLTVGSPRVELPPASGATSGRRLALAEWLVSPDHPLTSRVMINRIWHHHFGRGLVRTLDNFGKMGETPSHPALLDWLATEFIRSGWSIKQMHRLLMTSGAYQMSSSFASPANEKADPQNVYLWRFRMQRLEAEAVRDSLMSVSGALNRTMGGPAVFPELQPEVLASMKHGIWHRQSDGPEVWRRSVYVYRKRGLPFPFFEVFDLPDQNVSCGARNVSTVPTQALTLLNNEFVLKQSKLFAGRIRETAGAAPEDQLTTAYRLALGREPSAQEKATGLAFLQKNTLEDLAHVLVNLNEFMYIR